MTTKNGKGKNGNGTGNGTTPPDGGNGTGAAAIVSAIAAAEPVPADYALPPGFEMRPDGLWRAAQNGGFYRVCAPFEVVAESRPADGADWGLLIRWRDRDGALHDWIRPQRLLVGEAVEVRARLVARGLVIGAQDAARRALVEFLAAVRVPARVRTVGRTGWFHPPDGAPVFVLPGRTIGRPGGDVIRLDLDPVPDIYRAKGTLAAWRSEVAARCVGNSRLVFGLSAAFAAPVLGLTGGEGGAVHLRGDSSRGKTRVIEVAASAWGAPGKTGVPSFVRSWNTTAVAVEGTAVAHNHVLLPMDEISEADPATLPNTLYALANGSGRSRGRAPGGNRPVETWLTLVLSSGEETAANVIARIGRHVKAGVEVRMIDVPAEVEGAHGVFEELHGAPDGAAFAGVLRRAVVAQHGTAGPAFLEWLTAQLARDAAFIAGVQLERMEAWNSRRVPPGADGQVRRGATRFALIAVAGELATEAGVTGWASGTASHAAAQLFNAWLGERGGTGSREDFHLRAALRLFLNLHGDSRFVALKPPDPADDGAQVEPPLKDHRPVAKQAGWRWEEVNEAGRRLIVYGITPEVFDAEIALPLGFDGRDARGRLGRAGLIRGQREHDGMRWTTKPPRAVPGRSRLRLVVVEPRALGDDEAAGGRAD